MLHNCMVRIKIQHVLLSLPCVKNNKKGNFMLKYVFRFCLITLFCSQLNAAEEIERIEVRGENQRQLQNNLIQNVGQFMIDAMAGRQMNNELILGDINDVKQNIRDIRNDINDIRNNFRDFMYSINVSNISKYLSVRFGNVIGSSGSVLPTFRAQIKRGGPVTVTDPNITRYFMTVKEAVRLVLQSAVIGESGETLILDMGGPIKILEVAKRLIAASGKRIEIVFTGLRPGEKLHETLFSLGEQSAPTSHPLITKTSVQPLSIE